MSDPRRKRQPGDSLTENRDPANVPDVEREELPGDGNADNLEGEHGNDAIGKRHRREDRLT